MGWKSQKSPYQAQPICSMHVASSSTIVQSMMQPPSSGSHWHDSVASQEL